jgi:hypothetical protein
MGKRWFVIDVLRFSPVIGFACKVRTQSDRQFLELLIEEVPEARAETYPTLEEAIRMHDREFANQ